MHDVTLQWYVSVIIIVLCSRDVHGWSTGVVHEEINQSSPSGIIHGHLIVLVRHKQAQICLQSDPKCYERISTNVSSFLLPYSHTDAFSQV